MKTFEIYIKSHVDAPDYEDSVRAKNLTEAVEMFYTKLQGEFDREFIKKIF